MIRFNPEGKEVLTYGEALHPIVEVTDKEEARQYLSDYAAFIQKYLDKEPDPNGLTAVQIAKINIGYFSGYYGNETRERIQELFEAVHPIFGGMAPTAEEALSAGVKMEGGAGRNCPNQKSIELDIEWPEADIGGLHFNAQKTHGIFELKEDGNYYSRDILFTSARDTEEGTGRDILSEYLDREAVREAFTNALAPIENDMGFVVVRPDMIRVFLPEENQGTKKYNGVPWWYWLADKSNLSAAYFDLVTHYGDDGNASASAVGGVAPAFYVGHIRHE